jgi:hypothetical protein
MEEYSNVEFINFESYSEDIFEGFIEFNKEDFQVDGSNFYFIEKLEGSDQQSTNEILQNSSSFVTLSHNDTLSEFYSNDSMSICSDSTNIVLPGLTADCTDNELNVTVF